MIENGQIIHQGEIRRTFKSEDGELDYFEITGSPQRQKIISTLGGIVFNFAPVHQLNGLYVSEKRKLDIGRAQTFTQIRADIIATTVLFGSMEHNLDSDDGDKDHNIAVEGVADKCDYYLYDFEDSGAAKMPTKTALNFALRSLNDASAEKSILKTKSVRLSKLLKNKRSNYFKELTAEQKLDGLNLPFSDHESFLQRIQGLIEAC